MHASAHARAGKCLPHLDRIQIPCCNLACQVHPPKGSTTDGAQHIKVADAHAAGDSAALTLSHPPQRSAQRGSAGGTHPQQLCSVMQSVRWGRLTRGVLLPDGPSSRGQRVAQLIHLALHQALCALSQRLRLDGQLPRQQVAASRSYEVADLAQNGLRTTVTVQW